MKRSAWQTARFLWEGVLDLVYPPLCLLCERWDRPPICDDCYAAFAPIPEPICEICGRPRTPSLPCRNCEQALAVGGWGFDAVRAANIYYGPLREGIHKLKYRQEETLGPLLGFHLANRCVVDELLSREWRQRFNAVIPVPLHAQRLKQRGYNQTALLAAPVAEMLGVPLQEALIRRTQYTKAQVGLSGDARRRNLTDAVFNVSDSARIQDKHLLLVDDVFTTGTTVSVCAGVLKAAGAASVIVITLAAGD